MPQFLIQGEFECTGSQTKNIDIVDIYQYYRVFTSGTVNLSAGQAFTIRITDSNNLLNVGTIIDIEYDCDIVLAKASNCKVQVTCASPAISPSFAIIGNDSGIVPASYSGKKQTWRFFYDGTSWNYTIQPSFDNTAFVTGAMLDSGADIAVSQVALAEGSIIIGNSSTVGVALDAKTSGQIIVGNGTTATSVAVSGDITLSSAGVVAIAAGVIVNADVNASAAIAFSKLATLTSGNILVGSAGNVATSVAMSGDVTISNAGVTAIGAAVIEEADLTANLTYEIIPVLVSFETGYAGDTKIKIPFAGTITDIYAYATKVIAGTDNGVILLKDNGGTTLTGSTITFTASDARGTAYSTTATANNTFSAGDLLTINTAKVTAGGQVQLSIKITRT